MNETTQELAETMQDVYDCGIEVSLKEGDLRKVFVAVLAANIISYAAIRTYRPAIRGFKRGRALARKHREDALKEAGY